MQEKSIEQADRRREDRRAPARSIRVTKTIPVVPLSDAQVLNTSPHGVAIKTRVPLHIGDRLSFHCAPNTPPILAEVLAVEPLEDGAFRIRCKCLLGGFDERNSGESRG